MDSENFDVIIIGAGPAGCACAHTLASSGLNIAVIDKEKTPREKICGDALSFDVINQLDKLPLSVKNNFENIIEKIPSYGIRFYSPKSECLEILFELAEKKNISGYICKRIYFDKAMVDGLYEFPNIKLFEDYKVTDVKVNTTNVNITTDLKIFNAKFLVGADGANSMIAKKFSYIENDRKNLCLGMRGYFENVNGFHPGNYIELHFIKDVLPGYIWIFPMAKNTANVGIGMLASDVSEKKISLKNILEKYIYEHPDISKRFKNAKQTGKYEAWRIPLGIKKRKISGERFLLAGDAASLVDPFTGEGMGSAIRSGRLAAEHIKKCFENNCFSEKFNSAFDKNIYNKMWKELKMSYSIQKLFKHPKLINYAISKANSNEEFKKLIAEALQNTDVRKRFIKPYTFYKTFIR